MAKTELFSIGPWQKQNYSPLAQGFSMAIEPIKLEAGGPEWTPPGPPANGWSMVIKSHGPMENSFVSAMGQWKIVLFLPWANGK